MKRIYLLRHSEASLNSKDGDFTRQLTSRGINIATKQGKLMLEKKYEPELIVSSDAIRALETTAIFVDCLAYNKKVERKHFLYEEYSTNEFLNMVHEFNADIDSVLITGHNPTISRVAYSLSSCYEIAFPPCTIVVFDFAFNDWKQVDLGQGVLKEVILP